MKKAFVVMLLLSFMSCVQDSMTQEEIYANQISNLNHVYADFSVFDVEEFSRHISIIYPDADKTDIQIDEEGLLEMTSQSVENSFEHNFTDEQLSELYGRIDDELQYTGDVATKIEELMNANEHFTPEQTKLLKPFIRNILEDTDTFILNAENSVTEFNNEVMNSMMSDERKYELFSFSAMMLSLSKFLNEGQLETLTPHNAPKYARTEGCINYRNIMGSGAVGFFAGAVAGGIYGAAGGTVAFPLFGTATGAVGGAVFGGAAGFVRGIVLSATTAYVLCLRPTG